MPKNPKTEPHCTSPDDTLEDASDVFRAPGRPSQTLPFISIVETPISGPILEKSQKELSQHGFEIHSCFDLSVESALHIGKTLSILSERKQRTVVLHTTDGLEIWTKEEPQSSQVESTRTNVEETLS